MSREESRLLQAARRLHAAVFCRHVALKRAEHGVRLVLEDRNHAAPVAAADPQLTLLAQVRGELRDLLDGQPSTRRVMRHLVFVEGTLAQGGLAVLDGLPVAVLQHALEQLEGLVSNWTPVGLATLRSKMAVAISRREQQGRETEPDLRASTVPLALDSGEALPLAEECSDTAVLTAVYAALGAAAPGTVSAVASGSAETAAA